MSVNYSPRRLAAFQALWGAVRDRGQPNAPTLAQRAGALPKLVGGTVTGRYTGMTRGRLAVLGLAAGYLASPIDAVPEMFLAIFGLGDDTVLGTWLAGAMILETDRYLSWQRAGNPALVAGDADLRSI